MPNLDISLSPDVNCPHEFPENISGKPLHLLTGISCTRCGMLATEVRIREIYLENKPEPAYLELDAEDNGDEDNILPS